MPWILEEYTRLAARDLDASVACLSLVDPDRRLVTNSCGLSATSALLICWPFIRRVAATGRPLIVMDGRRDPATARHPAVRDGTVTAYMGIPLVNARGATVGTLSVMDRKPREWNARQFRYLRKLCAAIMQTLDEAPPPEMVSRAGTSLPVLRSRGDRAHPLTLSSRERALP